MESKINGIEEKLAIQNSNLQDLSNELSKSNSKVNDKIQQYNYKIEQCKLDTDSRMDRYAEGIERNISSLQSDFNDKIGKFFSHLLAHIIASHLD